MREDKKYLTNTIDAGIAHHGTFVMMNYKGITANKMNQFRREVATLGGDVIMMKKRILLKACADKGIDLGLKDLPGHISVVFGGNDPFETTKLVFKFRQESDKQVNVLCGQFEGKLYNGTDVETLSKLPSKDEMRAQFLATLEAPMAQTLAVMEALLSSVVYCLDNKSKEGQEGS